MILAFDIETVPLPGFWDAGADVDRATERTGEPPGLHPTTSMIVSVGFGWWENENMKTDVIMTHGRDSSPVSPFAESEVLWHVVNRLEGAAKKGTRLVTFNGKQFDLPMLRMRCALLGLAAKLPWRKWLYPFDERDHCDLRLVFTNGDRRGTGTQQVWAEAFGVPSEARGHEVLQMVREGRWDELAAYSHSDARTLLRLYSCINNIL